MLKRALLVSTALLASTPFALAQSSLGPIAPPQVQSIGPNDLFPIIPDGNVGAGSKYVPSWLLNNIISQTPFPGAISPAPRSAAERADDMVNPRNYYAVCDGDQHPLSERFSSVQAAQKAFTVQGVQLVTVTSLDQDLDTLGMQAALNTGKLVWFPDNGQCWIRQQIVYPYTLNGVATKGVGITGDGSGTFLASTTDFPSTTGANATTPLGNPILIAGSLTGNPTIDNANPIDRPIIQGFKFKFTTIGTQGNVRPIIAINSKNLVWNNVEETGVNSSGNLAEIDASTGWQFTGNNIHDGLLDRQGSTGQLTGLAIDDTVPTGLNHSSGWLIANNTIQHFTVTTQFKAAFNYQTDAITIVHDTGAGLIIGNVLSDVGEPIDFAGSNGIIVGNNISFSHLASIKLIHDAQGNIVVGNLVYCPALAGIEVVGSSFTQDVSHNWIRNNLVRLLDCNSEEVAHAVFGFGAIDTTNQTFTADNNTFDDNTVDTVGGSSVATRIAAGGNAFAFEAGGSGSGNTAYTVFYTPDFQTPIKWVSPQTPSTFPVTNLNGVISSFTGTTTFGADQVNNLTLSGNTTTNPPNLRCIGTDTDVGCNLVTQGAGIFRFRDGNGDLFRIIDPGGAAVNYAQIRPGVSGNGPLLNPGGSANAPFTISGAGTEGVRSNFYVRTADPTTADITTGLCADWNNTSAGTLKRVCNLAGTLHSITYP